VSSLGSDGQWSEPKNLGENINSKNADAVCSVNEDARDLLYQ